MSSDNTEFQTNEMAAQRESRLRSLLKAVSYRIIGTVTTASVALFVTGDGHAALAIGAVEPLAKIVIYYVHERAWQMAPRGTVRQLVQRVRQSGR